MSTIAFHRILQPSDSISMFVSRIHVLTQQNTVISKSTTFINIRKICILQSECIYVFNTIFGVERKSFELIFSWSLEDETSRTRRLLVSCVVTFTMFVMRQLSTSCDNQIQTLTEILRCTIMGTTGSLTFKTVHEKKWLTCATGFWNIRENTY